MKFNPLFKYASFVLLTSVLILSSCKLEEKEPEKLARKVKILSPSKSKVKYGSEISMEIKVLDGVESINFLSNKKLIKSLKSPQTSTIKETFNSSDLGLGKRTIVVESKLTSGKTLRDTRNYLILSNVVPDELTFKEIKAYPHRDSSFTQGLEFNQGVLYESTGLNGQSMIAKVDLNSGKVLTRKNLDAKYFGEGITIFNGNLYQLTWQKEKCFVYDANTLELKNEMSYRGEGWGLTHDSTHIIMSNGTNEIVFRNPKNFEIIRSIKVVNDTREATQLNELEYFNNAIYANVYLTNDILKIDPISGKVLAVINASHLDIQKNQGAKEFNGIAYNPKTGKIYVTGKEWNKLYEVEIE